MNECTRHSILSLPFTSNEINSTNRNKSAYHTYVSVFIEQFNELTFNEQKELLLNDRIHCVDPYLQYEHHPILYDQPKASAADKMRLASKHWGRLCQELKDSWSERSKSVNDLPIIGRFHAVPKEVTDEVILDCMNLEYEKFVALMNGALKRAPRFIDSIVYKTFGKERILRRSKFFRSIHLNHILKILFFGPSYSYLRCTEIVYRTKASVVIHINSKERIEELFAKNGVCAFLVNVKNDEKNTSYTCAGRVIVRVKGTRKEGIGYVDKEEQNRFFITLESGLKIDVTKPFFEKETGRWIFGYNNEDKYEIVEYEPVRIKILEKGNIHFLFHRVEVYNDI